MAEIMEQKQARRLKNIVIAVLEDSREYFQCLITDIDEELAKYPRNELTEVLESVRAIAKNSLSEIDADLKRLTGL